jgi:hypothetical protein
MNLPFTIVLLYAKVPKKESAKINLTHVLRAGMEQMVYLCSLRYRIVYKPEASMFDIEYGFRFGADLMVRGGRPKG